MDLESILNYICKTSDPNDNVNEIFKVKKNQILITPHISYADLFTQASVNIKFPGKNWNFKLIIKRIQENFALDMLFRYYDILTRLNESYHESKIRL